MSRPRKRIFFKYSSNIYLDLKPSALWGNGDEENSDMPGMVVQTINPNNWEAEAGRSPRVWSQPGLQKETL